MTVPCGSRRRLVAIALAALCLSACSRREGLNFDCNWVPDPPQRVDLHDASHIQHLLADIRAAEELAIRHGDRMAGWRLVEAFGIVSRHGGLKNRDLELGRQSRQQCVAKLLPVIASTHGVAVSDIESLWPQLSNRGFDLPVTLPLALLFVLALMRFTRWMAHRFETGEWAGWFVATLFGSLIIPTMVVAIGTQWAAAVEIIRLGNEHLGERARMGGLRANFIVMLGIGVAAVWIGSAITAVRKRAEVSNSPVS